MAQELGQALVAQLAGLSIDQVFDEGLHEFLTRFIQEVAKLGSAVSGLYLSGDLQ